MTPGFADYLAKAREHLSKARNVLGVLHYSDEAARAAYLASFHAAHAFIFARTGRVPRTHSGLRSIYARLAAEEPRLDPAFTRFLARAYTFKEVTDYGVSSQATLSADDAEEMIETARGSSSGLLRSYNDQRRKRCKNLLNLSNFSYSASSSRSSTGI